MKLKAFVKCVPETLGIGLHRVARALALYAPPEIEIVDNKTDADIVVIHVIGHGSMQGWDLRPDQKQAMIQYCLKTTEDARPEAWSRHWTRSCAIWSYYDLQDYCAKRNALPPPDDAWKFYHAPLGVDGTVFKPSMPARKLFAFGTSGYIAETEGVRECYEAASSFKRDMFHLGPRLGLGQGVCYIHGITDREVAEFWSQCSYVAGMRRIEGFELPALEGLACGSRPVVFDAPHYRHWFGEHAEYVPEADHDTVVDALKSLLSKPVRPVTPAERTHALGIFDWKKLVTGFWENAL
jgi:glycosyltransferase involved in cell wall biosynthesis